MDTLQLKLFISVSQTLSFTKTAHEFYMSQPSVSNYIKALETNIGVKLVNRDSHGVSLTPEGEGFVEYAGDILRIQMEAETRLRNISKGRTGYIRIAMLSSTAKLFSESLARFLEGSPGVQVDVFKLEGAEMMRSISRHDYDIYFANRYMVHDGSNVDFAVTGSAQLRLFAHIGIADKIDIDDWSTLKKFRFVSVPEMDFALSGQIKNICLSRGITPDIINYYNHADTVLLAVNSGIGLAILPPGLTFYNFPNVVSMPIEGEDAVVQSVVAWHTDKLNADIQSFLRIEPFRHLIPDGLI